MTNNCPNARITNTPIPSHITFDVDSIDPIVVEFDEWVVDLVVCGSL